MDRANMKSLTLLRKQARLKGTLTIDVPLFIAQVKHGKVLIVNQEGLSVWVSAGDTYIANAEADVIGGADNVAE